ncbi:MAG: PaaI family thioesterase [Thermoanaerobaculia bacterium]
MDEIRTHRLLDRILCGEPVLVEEGRAEVTLPASRQMAADAPGLIHGGFVFGAADHAAMLAVNEPTVVLVRADVRFVAPVAVGDRMVARARVVEGAGDPSRPVVEAEVEVGGRTVFTGTFECALPAHHVLERDEDGPE